MQQPDSLFWIGRKVGALEARQRSTEARVSAIEELLASARRYALRAALLALLWAGVIGAGLSRDELAELLALAIRKTLSIG